MHGFHTQYSLWITGGGIRIHSGPWSGYRGIKLRKLSSPIKLLGFFSQEIIFFKSELEKVANLRVRYRFEKKKISTLKRWFEQSKLFSCAYFRLPSTGRLESISLATSEVWQLSSSFSSVQANLLLPRTILNISFCGQRAARLEKYSGHLLVKRKQTTENHR